MDKPVIKQLDHIIARTSDANALFSVFSETLQLPVAWPVRSLQSFTSGGISLGNLYLEILSVGSQSNSDEKEVASFCAFAFEVDDLKACVKELQKRKLKCSAVVPYVDSPDGGPQRHLWSNAFLDGLIGTDYWTRYVIFSTKTPGYQFWANLLRGSSLERAGISRLFSGALSFLVEYNYESFASMAQWSDYRSHDEKRAADAEALREREVGALSLQSVKEIVVSVKDYERAQRNWEKLFAPVASVEQGLWEIADGPAVRVLEGDKDAIRSLIFKVSDLSRAETFLREKDMLGTVADNQIQIAPAKIQGLDLRLV